MTRCIWLTFYGEPRGAAAEHAPHESGPRITVPLMILAALAIFAGFGNLPDTGVLSLGARRSSALRFEHFVEPTGALLPDRLAHGEFERLDRADLHCAWACSVRPRLPLVLQEQGPARHHRAQPAAPALGHTMLVNKYYLDWLYTDVIAGGIKGPIARATYWFNQNVIDGVVNGAAELARSPGSGSTTTSTRAWSTPSSRARAPPPRAAARSCAGARPARCRQYGAYLFLGAAFLAAVFVIAS